MSGGESKIEWARGATFTRPEPETAHRLLVSGCSGRQEAASVGAALAAAAAAAGRPALVVSISGAGGRMPSLFSTSLSRGVCEIVSARYRDLAPVPRGSYGYVELAAEEEGQAERISELARAMPASGLVVVLAEPERFRRLAESEVAGIDSAVVRADPAAHASVLALLTADLQARRIEFQVWKSPLSRFTSALARAGVPPVGVVGTRAKRLTGRLLGVSAPDRTDSRSGVGSVGSFGGERGQVTVLALGLVFLILTAAVISVALGGALTGKARAQRAADLVALSAARSLRDDLPRRLSPPVVGGKPNPFHLTRTQYLARARQAARAGARANEVGSARVVVRFGDRLSPAPLRAEVRLRSRLELEAGGARAGAFTVTAAAEAVAPLPGSGALAAGSGAGVASGGGYSGPLQIRQGKGMRPDVAVAFDRMAAAAAAAGHLLTVNSAFRSDEEQAALFAANPDPKWVAPPGQSLHRCATELDLGPASAYGWLAANAPRFGFTLRYEWEAWHFGYTAGPEPCAPGAGFGSVAAVGAGSRGSGEGAVAGAAAVPAYVPARFREMIARAAARWNLAAELLAAQLQAESNFDPGVTSHAGAQGIAQFMPGTAAAYGLTDPFDPGPAIMAQAQLMSDLLAQFDGSVELALAAYNAGPGAVAPCDCVPDYPETQAYVAKIVSLLAGSGAALTLPLEVRLVE